MKWLYLTLVFSLLFVGAYAQKKPAPIPNKNNQILIDPVEEGPSFPGGQKAFYKFLSKNLKWPGDPEVSGRVIVGFVVEKDGSLTHFKILRSLGKDFDAEALRVLKKSPKWMPATINSKPVRRGVMQPINFIIGDSSE
jgi:protein TonB